MAEVKGEITVMCAVPILSLQLQLHSHLGTMAANIRARELKQQQWHRAKAKKPKTFENYKTNIETHLTRKYCKNTSN
jgi:uncharacterized membrane-anchored protein YhcB (DUF1043 family)